MSENSIDYKLTETQNINYSILTDKLKPIKDVLTNLVNDFFIHDNKNEIKLIKLIYKHVDIVLKKYGMFLVFKGGNVLRLINNNIMKYFPKDSDEIINEIFSPFLKFSDNDFTVWVDPNLMNYRSFYKDILYELFQALDDIREEYINNLEEYFYIYKLNKIELSSIKENLIEKLNEVDKKDDYFEIQMNKTSDKIITLNNDHNKILIFSKIGKEYEFFNSMNFTLDFHQDDGRRIKFSLLRTKLNFLINSMNSKKNVSGELIDISVPHKEDSTLKKLDSEDKFAEFISKNVKKINDKKNGFTYYLVNIEYIINDLFEILFSGDFPWEDSKYEKRMARLIYFIFLGLIDHEKISIKNLNKIKICFKKFKKSLIRTKKLKYKCNHLIELSTHIEEVEDKLKTTQDEKKYEDMISSIIKYSNEIIKIIDSIISYLNNKVKIRDIYEINI